MKDNWKEELRTKMSGYSEPAPDGMWEDIMSACSAKRRRKRNVLLIAAFSGVAAAAAIAVIFTPAPASFSPQEAARDNIVAVVEQDRAETAQPAADEVKPPVDKQLGTDMDVQTSDRQPQTDVDMQPVTEPSEEETTPAAMDEVSGGKAVPDAGRTEDVRENVDSGHVADRRAYDWQQLLLAEASEVKERKKPSLNIYASGFAGGSSVHNGYSQAVSKTAMTSPMSYGENALAGILMLNRTKEISTQTRHHLPVRAGVSFSYNITPRWSIGTGLSYSWLLSTSRTGSESYYVDSRQTLHYLGIPVMASCGIWSNSWFKVYVSAGGMMEKCVGGNVSTGYIYSNDIRDSQRERLMVKPLQWSVTALAGVQFSLSPLIGIYLEPGAIYYFDNGSDIETVYSDRPLNFNLNLGIRFSFDR